MGRLESLTSWALGRTPYEDEVVEFPHTTGRPGAQQYNEHGRPRNPETKRRERDSVRAANEVMQVTGVVEDSLVAKARAKAYKQEKNEDTFTGLRLMEVGRSALVGGVWGVLGLRRRILLYRPYSEMGFLEILRNESEVKSIPSFFLAGIPTVIAYHISDWTGFVIQSIVDSVFDEDEDEYTPGQLWFKHTGQILLDVAFCYVTLNFRMFAILQQLNLIPGSHLLPSLRSFIPFSAASPLQLPAPPSLEIRPILSWGFALFRSATPLLVILAHGKLKFFVARLFYRPIYKSLPRPTGDSMFSGLPISTPSIGFDTPDIPFEEERPRRGEDTPTLRALEGLPALDREEREEARMRQSLMDQDDSSEDENDEVQQTTLISFDVEAAHATENSMGTWSAELRSANEPKSKIIQYRVTGLTMLPTILATEGLREICAGILVIPLEAVMVRIIGRAYLQNSGLSLSSFYEVFAFKDAIPAWRNLVGAFAIQVVATGVIWAGFTLGSQRWAGKRRSNAEDRREPPH